MHKDIGNILRTMKNREERREFGAWSRQWLQRKIGAAGIAQLRHQSPDVRQAVGKQMARDYQAYLRELPFQEGVLDPTELETGFQQRGKYRFSKEAFTELSRRPMAYGAFYYESKTNTWRRMNKAEEVPTRYPLIYAPGGVAHGQVRVIGGLAEHTEQYRDALRRAHAQHQVKRNQEIARSRLHPTDYQTEITYRAPRPDHFTRRGKDVYQARGNDKHSGQFASGKAPVVDIDLEMTDEMKRSIEKNLKIQLLQNFRASPIDRNREKNEATGTLRKAISEGKVTSKQTPKGFEITLELADLIRPHHSWEHEQTVSTLYYGPRVFQGRRAVFPVHGKYLLYKRSGEWIATKSARPSRQDLNILELSNEQRGLILKDLAPRTSLKIAVK